MARAALLLFLAGCAFGEIDYTGKTCPCPSEYGCTTNGTCCLPAIRGENFRVAWTAPNTIRFEWDPIGDAASFGAYEMRLGTPNGVERITAERNPQFAYFDLPLISDDNIPVDSAMVFDLEPSTPYWGELQAIDNTGCTWVSPAVHTTTAVAPLSDQVPLLIFDETLDLTWLTGPDGVSLLVTDEARASCNSSFLEWTPTMTNQDTNVQLYSLGMPLAPVGEWLDSSAFIEYRIARNVPSYWARVVLSVFDPAIQEGRHARLEAMSLPGDDAYHTVQVPIRVLDRGAGQPAYTPSDTLHRFLVGFSPWEANATMRVDCVRIRW